MKPLRTSGVLYCLPVLLVLLAGLATLTSGGTGAPGARFARRGGGASTDDKPKTKKETQLERLIPSLKGPDLFRAYCASCHGVTAKGDGPAAAALNSKVPDLTTITQRNGGIFPEARMRSIVAGDEVVAAHGSREMPIWGPIFHQIEEDRDYGNIRMQNLIQYLRSIQQK